jgi:hypothetical protein
VEEAGCSRQPAFSQINLNRVDGLPIDDGESHSQFMEQANEVWQLANFGLFFCFSPFLVLKSILKYSNR